MIERQRLPDDRQSITKKCVVGDMRGYATIGLYPDGRPGELFINIDKAGSTAHGFVDAASLAASLLLQSGEPLWAVFGGFLRGRNEDYAGSTAATVLDLTARWALTKFKDSQTLVHEFKVGAAGGFLVVGLKDGQPVDIRVVVDVVDSSVRDAVVQVSDLTSKLLRIGMPLQKIADKFIGTRFEPDGFTGDPMIPMTTSVLDYVMRWLWYGFYPEEYAEKYGTKT